MFGQRRITSSTHGLLRCALCCVAALIGCGGQPPSPYFDDAAYLRFGVDPRVEADAIEAQLKRADMQVVQRAEGPHHVALGIESGARDRSGVRVISSRGTVLSLDSHAVVMRTRDYRLLVADERAPLPADEILVQVIERSPPSSCLAAFRVDARGVLARVVIDAGAVIVGGCASEIEDANADGSPELVVHATYTSLLPDDPPVVRVPLTAHGGGYRFVAGVGPVIAMLATQRVQAEQELAVARRALNVTRAMRSALELAAIARFDGVSTGEQLKTFDAALRGLVLTGAQAASIEQARARIREGWTDPEAVGDDPLTPEAASEQSVEAVEPATPPVSEDTHDATPTSEDAATPVAPVQSVPHEAEQGSESAPTP